MALKKFIFFECFFFREYDIGIFLFVFWLRNRPSIKYVRNWGESSKMYTGAYRERGVEKSVIKYVRTR